MSEWMNEAWDQIKAESSITWIFHSLPLQFWGQDLDEFCFCSHLAPSISYEPSVQLNNLLNKWLEVKSHWNSRVKSPIVISWTFVCFLRVLCSLWRDCWRTEHCVKFHPFPQYTLIQTMLPAPPWMLETETSLMWPTSRQIPPVMLP